MNGLNMHVISNDFYSQCMRRVKHWNSFNTELFLTYQAVYALIRIRGSIEPMPAEKANELRNALPLRCNQCDFETDVLLGLKGHLFDHWKKREATLQVKLGVEKITRMLDDAKLTTLPKAAPDKAPLPPNQSKSNKAVKSGNHDPNLPTNPFKREMPATNRNPSNRRQNMNNQGAQINRGQRTNHFDKNAQKSFNNQCEFRQFNQRAFNGPNMQGPGLNNRGPNYPIGNTNINMQRLSSEQHSQSQYQPSANKSSAPKALNQNQGKSLQKSQLRKQHHTKQTENSQKS